MLVRPAWPSRPTFDSAFADFDSARREMLRLIESVAGENLTLTLPKAEGTKPRQIRVRT